MKKYLLHQESGFLHDLHFLFYSKFNDQGLSQKRSGHDKAGKTSELYRGVQPWFEDISDDLYLFFHCVDAYDCDFLEYCYLKEYEQDFIKKYHIDSLQQDLADYDQVIRNVIRFYFKGMEDHELAECLGSKNAIFERIKASRYSPEEKLKLYEFFVNPTSYVLLLRCVLTEKQSLLNEYYHDHYKRLMDAYDPAFLDAVNERMENGELSDIQDERQPYVSFCLLDRFHFQFISSADACLFILGDQYQHSLETSAGNSESRLQKFCTALCDDNRIRIFELLLERKEVTCKELERTFDFSGSTAYHHISLMNKAGLLKARNKGKVILYSINKGFVTEVMDQLRQYCE